MQVPQIIIPLDCGLGSLGSAHLRDFALLGSLDAHHLCLVCKIPLQIVSCGECVHLLMVLTAPQEPPALLQF